MNRKQPNPKVGHYVPESYLNRFTDGNGFLHVWDFVRRHKRRARPDKVMKINRYYCQKWAPLGIDPNIFEIELGKGLESEVRSVIDRLNEATPALNDHEVATLLNYMELQRIRVPRQAETAKMLMREEILKSAPPDVSAKIAAGRFQLTMKDSARFEYMKMALGTICPWLARMEWEVVGVKNGAAFITTDSPVSFFNHQVLPPAEAGVGLAGTVVLFPLSSRKLLFMRHPEGRSLPPLNELPLTTLVDGLIKVSYGAIWTKQRVELINRRMAYLAHELIVGESEEVLRSSGSDRFPETIDDLSHEKRKS